MAVTITKKAVASDKPTAKGKISFMPAVIKGDTYLVLSQPQAYPEDEFAGAYYTVNARSNLCLEPPFEPKRLKALVTQNNILSQCVTAMEVNVAGTGYELEPLDKDNEGDKTEIANIKAFLDEPYPQKSIVSLRRELQRDVEEIGWGALEVIRNLFGNLVGLRRVEASLLRFVRLDDAVKVKRKLFRGGKEVEFELWERERRFAQKVGSGPNDFRFFREYGTSRELNWKTGEWADKGALPPELRATELLVFKALPDTATPYGIPRWINNLPSVLGSRKAEEANLEFFDSGGMPPAIIFVEGGILAKDMTDQLKMYLSGQMKSKMRAAIVEAQSSSGTLDSSGKVSVKVERFGAEATKDAMFQNYDKNSEDHVRVSFRLPPLFLGRSADYNYASAQVSYMVAEAQVFQPERTSFDEVFNLTIMRELGAKTVRFKSKSITMKNVEAQVAALTIAKDISDGAAFVADVNRIYGLQLEFSKEKDKAMLEKLKAPAVAPSTNKPSRKPGAKDGVKPGPGGASKTSHVGTPKGTKKLVPGAAGKKSKASVKKLDDLSTEFIFSQGIIESDTEYTDSEKTVILKSVDELPTEERFDFWNLLRGKLDAYAVETSSQVVETDVVA